jgi:hypothetical protein
MLGKYEFGNRRLLPIFHAKNAKSLRRTCSQAETELGMKTVD